MAGRAADHGCGRLGRLAHDLRLCDLLIGRVRQRQHCGPGVTGNARRHGGTGCALSDAMAARNRECRSGTGKFCREREATVADRRQALDKAMREVATTSDPQTDAAVHMVAWISGGTVRPSGDDFAMLRLALLALLPQVGGVLLMPARAS